MLLWTFKVGNDTNEGNIVVQKSTGGVLLPSVAVNFDRYLVGEVSNKLQSQSCQWM